jgi:hypothetical protein
MTYTETATCKQLAVKINECSMEIKSIEKTGKNEKQGYRFTPGGELFRIVRKVLQTHGVTIFPSCEGVTVIAQYTTASGGTMFVYSASMTYTLVDITSGESMQCQYMGTGADTGDKGIYKAYTAALKYFLRDLFQIPFGEEPDDDSDSDDELSNGEKSATATQSHEKPTQGWSGKKPDEPASDKQKNLILGILGSCGFDNKEVVEKIFEKMKATELSKITKREASSVIDKLNAMGGKVKESDGINPARLSDQLSALLQGGSK